MISEGHVRHIKHSNMAPRLSGQTSIFGVVFFVSKSLLEIERRKKLKIFTIFTRTPRSDVRILIYQTVSLSRRLSHDHLRRKENYLFCTWWQMVLSLFVATNKTDSWIRISSYNINFMSSFYGVAYEYRMSIGGIFTTLLYFFGLQAVILNFKLNIDKIVVTSAQLNNKCGIWG